VKTITGLMIITCIIFSNTSVWCDELIKTSQFAGQWPYHSSKSIAIVSAKQLIIFGNGNTINVLDSDLSFISSIVVTETSQISGLFFSATDNLLYIACRTEGLKIFDLADSENPILVTSYPPNFFETVGVFIDGSRAYLSSGVDGMVILDITDKKNPVMLSQSRLPGGFGISYAIDIYASRNYAFVADLYNGLHIVDVNDPQEPDYKKGIALAGATDITVSGNYLYMTLQSTGMAILDVSTPENTSLKSLFAAEDVATSVRVNGSFAFISYISTGIRALDISNQSEPFHDPTWIYDASGGNSLEIFPGENFLFCANDQFGLQKIDISDKSNMQPLASYDTPAGATAIDISGSYVYALDNNVGEFPEKEGLRIHQVSASNQVAVFEFKGFCPTPGRASGIKVLGDFAFVADGQQGLQIINILDKTNPKITATYDTEGYANGIFIDGNLAYLADGDQGISIINVTDKTNPILTSTIDTNGFAKKICISDDYAYIAVDDQGLVIINIFDKTNPEITGSFDTPGTANGIFVEGNYAYVADGANGMCIIDISNKTNPILTGVIDTNGFAENISVSANYVYVADRMNGLCTIDASNPFLPVSVNEWSYNSPGITTDVFSGYFADDEELFAFIADGPTGVIGINLRVQENINNEGESTDNSTGGGCFIRAASE